MLLFKLLRPYGANYFLSILIPGALLRAEILRPFRAYAIVQNIAPLLGFSVH
jgi:hypothetical protein